MKRILTAVVVAVGLLAAAPTAVGPSSAVAQECQEVNARSAVQKGLAKSLSGFLGKIASATGGGGPDAARLCNLGGRLMYDVQVLTGNNKQRRLWIDAITGDIRNSR